MTLGFLSCPLFYTTILCFLVSIAVPSFKLLTLVLLDKHCSISNMIGVYITEHVISL